MNNKFFLVLLMGVFLLTTTSALTWKHNSVNTMSLDNSGNLNVLGNVTAKAFIGDGSGLTNLNISAIDTSNLVPYTGSDKNIALGNYNFSIGTSELFVNSNTGNVGIGTMTPKNKLNVIGDANITGNLYVNNKLILTSYTETDPIWLSQKSNYIPYTGANQNVDIGNNNFSVGNGRFFVDDNSGNVGIGTTNPQSRLDVNGDILSRGTIYNSNKKISITKDDIYFNNKQITTPPTYPSPSHGFRWGISTDGAGMRVLERGRDELDYRFFMRDNLASVDRYLWKVNEWRGYHASLEAMELYPGRELNIRNPTKIYGGLYLKSPELANTYRPDCKNNTLQFQQTTIVRNNQDCWNPDIGNSQLVMSVDVSGYTGTIASAYIIEIKDNTSSPNTFSWGNGAVSNSIVDTSKWVENGINVSTSWITLSDGIKIKFNQITGGIANETFGFVAVPGGSLHVESSNPSSFIGSIGIGTTTPSQKLDVNGNINIADGSSYMYNGVQALRLAKGTDSYYANTFIGRNTGNASATRQTAVGNYAGNSNTGNYQTALGYYAGNSNTGTSQTAIGYYAGNLNTGTQQIAIGFGSGYQNTGASQTALGFYAGQSNTGASQTALGYQAGQSNTGDRVTGLGYSATFNNSGNDVVAIGYQAGKDNTVANQFIVKQNNINTIPLIQGDFATGNVGIGTTTPKSKLDVVGNGNFTGNLYVKGEFVGGSIQMSGNLNITNKNITTSGNGLISSNSTCIKIKGSTSELDIC